MRSTAESCSFYNTTITFKPADASAGFFVETSRGLQAVIAY